MMVGWQQSMRNDSDTWGTLWEWLYNLGKKKQNFLCASQHAMKQCSDHNRHWLHMVIPRVTGFRKWGHYCGWTDVYQCIFSALGRFEGKNILLFERHQHLPLIEEVHLGWGQVWCLGVVDPCNWQRLVNHILHSLKGALVENDQWAGCTCLVIQHAGIECKAPFAHVFVIDWGWPMSL